MSSCSGHSRTSGTKSTAGCLPASKQRGLDLRVQLRIFQLYDGVKVIHIQKNLHLNFDFSSDAGQEQCASTPDEPRSHEGNQPIH